MVGALEAGEVVDIVEEQVLENGASRLRLERPAGASGPVGWVSATGPTGQAFLVPAGDGDTAQAREPASPSMAADAPASPSVSSDAAAPTAAEPKKGWFGWGTGTKAAGEHIAAAVGAAAETRVEKPLVPVERVRMVSVVTRTDEKGKQYTAFGITVYPLPVATGVGGGEFVTAEEWVVHRRFSEFVELRTQLLALDKQFEQVEFPSKHASMFTGAAQVNTARRLALERWLTAVLAQPTSNKLVSRFVEPEVAAATPNAASAADSAKPATASVATPASEPTPASAAEDPAMRRTWRLRKVKIAAAVPTGDDAQTPAGAKEDTAYTLQVHPREKGSEFWEVSRKYSEFCTLRVALRKSCGAVLRSNDRVFPVERVWNRKQLDTKAAENRLTALQTWMDNVVGLRPDEVALMDFVSAETSAGGEVVASRNGGIEEPVVQASEASAAWGASLTALLASPALAIMRSAAGGLADAGTAGATAAGTRPAGRELPLPLDAAWADAEKFLTPSALRSNDAPIQYPTPSQVLNVYTAEQNGLLPAPSVDLYRITHEHRPGLGFQPLVVNRANITGISTKYSQGKEFTVYVNLWHRQHAHCFD